MAKRRSNAKSGPSKSARPRLPAFAFEAGEKELALPATTVQLDLEDKGVTLQYVPLPPQKSLPSHLRVLGVRVRLSVADQGCQFLEGPRIVKSVTKDIPFPFPEGKAIPTYKVFGPVATKTVLVAQFSARYKDV